MYRPACATALRLGSHPPEPYKHSRSPSRPRDRMHVPHFQARLPAYRNIRTHPSTSPTSTNATHVLDPKAARHPVSERRLLQKVVLQSTGGSHTTMTRSRHALLGRFLQTLVLLSDRLSVVPMVEPPRCRSGLRPSDFAAFTAHVKSRSCHVRAFPYPFRASNAESSFASI